MHSPQTIAWHYFTVIAPVNWTVQLDNNVSFLPISDTVFLCHGDFLVTCNLKGGVTDPIEVKGFLSLETIETWIVYVCHSEGEWARQKM